MCQLLQAFCHICLSDSGVVFESKVLVSRHFRDIKSLGLEAKVLVILSKKNLDLGLQKKSPANSKTFCYLLVFKSTT